MTSQTRLILVSSITAFLVGGAIFFAACWFSKINIKREETSFNTYNKDKLTEFDIQDDLLKVDKDRIKSHLNELAKLPHLAGLERDEALAVYIRDKWQKYGLDSVEIHQYEVLLSYPDERRPNKVQILDGSKVILTARHQEDLGDQEWDDRFVDAYLAYTPAGTAQGDVVYVNYGKLEDYALLSNKSSPYYTNVSGKICMMRFGLVFRGNKVQNAYDNGCAGAILFKDPSDVAAEGTDADHVFPNTFWLPGSGMERGNTRMSKGDPETPSWPSIPNVYRLEGDDLEDTLPKIPSQTIGYDDARSIMSKLVGKEPPQNWKGAVEFPYTIGGKFSTSNCGLKCKLVLQTNNRNERKVSSNTIGVLKGDIEPDRYVIIGNHRDAIGYGAIDPSSGSAQLMEVVRILCDKVKNQGWRPRRTIIFASWGAEEFGLIGSREFLEEFAPKLSDRAVAYVNMDSCAAGRAYFAAASPSVKHLYHEAAKKVPSPFNETQSVYDHWKKWHEDVGLTGEPKVSLLLTDTDSAFFIYFLGIASMSSIFFTDSHVHPTIRNNAYPMYHSAFETLYLVENMIDPGYKIHEACARLNMALGRDLADRILLDFRPEEYVTLMRTALEGYKADGTIDKMTEDGILTENWIAAVDKFEAEIQAWRSRLDESKEDLNPLIIRSLNDQMMKLDRSFLLAEGLPGRPDFHHAIIATSKYNTFRANGFPGVGDLMWELNGLRGKQRMEKVKVIKKHMSDLMVILKGAGDFLKDVGMI